MRTLQARETGSVGVATLLILVSCPAAADTPDDKDAWRDLASDGKSHVFGRFVGKLDSTQFRSRRIRLREINTGEDETLTIGDYTRFDLNDYSIPHAAVGKSLVLAASDTRVRPAR